MDWKLTSEELPAEGKRVVVYNIVNQQIVISEVKDGYWDYGITFEEGPYWFEVTFEGIDID